MPWGLTGLERAKTALGNMLANNRVPHGLLFAGPRGSGKFTMALALAKALNCPDREPDFSPCGKCHVCRRIEAGGHPDVMTLSPKGRYRRIAIDDVRALRDALGYRPYEADFKVAVIRGADSFGQESGGALLKTLEEPTPSTVLILTAASERDVMETLVSRCVRLKFDPLGRGLVLEALVGRGCRPGRAALLAGLSDGALGAAQSLDPEAAEFAWGGVDGIYGSKGEPGALMRAFEWTTEMLEENKRRKKTDDDPDADLPALTAKCMRLWWRDAGVLAATGDPSRCLGPPPSPGQRKIAAVASAALLARVEKSMARLEDGLMRLIRLEVLFENHWLDVLE
ncbi:MAG: DNA polymerase III subunit [Deltaproteobacteria bacterium]|jgi:DNA polymerase III delta' subunit|nr:DNA polymerase III subunit [Deltaproteobacteria bacterium]